MLKRLIGVLAAAAMAAVTAGVASPTVAEATPVFKVIKVYYDSPGSDDRTNTSINGEYVIIKNMTTASQSLTRYTVRDNASHVYTFGTFALGAGKTVVLRTGKGTNSSTTRYWGYGSYVWNNDTDRATLKNSAGTTVHYCGYNSTAYDYKNC